MAAGAEGPSLRRQGEEAEAVAVPCLRSPAGEGEGAEGAGRHLRACRHEGDLVMQEPSTSGYVKLAAKPEKQHARRANLQPAAPCTHACSCTFGSAGWRGWGRRRGCRRGG